MSAYARSALLRKTLNRPSSRPNTPRDGTITKISNRFSQKENEGTETQLNTHDPYQFSQISFMEQNFNNNEEKKNTNDNRNPYKVTKSAQLGNRILSQTLSQSSYQESNNRMIQMSQNSTNVSTLTEENIFSQSQSQRKSSIISGTETSESFQKSNSTSIKQEKQSPAVGSSSKRPWMSSCMDIINPYRRKRIKQQNSSTETPGSNGRKYIEYNDSKVDSSNDMNNALVVRSNNTPLRLETEFKTPTRYNTHQEDNKRTPSFSQDRLNVERNSREVIGQNNHMQDRQILEAQCKANQELMAKLQEQNEKGNQQLMVKLQEQNEKENHQLMEIVQKQSEKENRQLFFKLQEQGEYMKHMNRILENQERKTVDLEEKIKNMTEVLQNREDGMAKYALIEEENKATIRNLQQQSQSTESNISQLLEIQKQTFDQLKLITIRENDNSNLLDNIATNQVDLSKKQDDLYRHTLDQSEKQKQIFDEMSEKLSHSMKRIPEFFDASMANLTAKFEDSHKYFINLLNEKLYHVAEEFKELASAMKGQLHSILSQIEENRKLDKSKITYITPPKHEENHYNDTQSQIKFSQVSATPEISNRSNRSSMSSKQKDQDQNINDSVCIANSLTLKSKSNSALSKKKSDYLPKIIPEKSVADPNFIFTDVQNAPTVSKYAVNGTTSSKKSITSTASRYAANSTTSSKKIANRAEHLKKVALPLKNSSSTSKKRSKDRMDPKIPKTVEIITNNSTSRPQKQVRRSKRLKDSSLVKKFSEKKKVTIQVPEKVASKKPATKVATKSSSRGISKSLKDDSKKSDIVENSEDTFCFQSQPESPKKRSFMSLASPAALLSFFTPSKKDEPPKYGKNRKKRRLNLSQKL